MKITKAVSLFLLHLLEGSSGISEMKDTVKALKKNGTARGETQE